MNIGSYQSAAFRWLQSVLVVLIAFTVCSIFIPGKSFAQGIGSVMLLAVVSLMGHLYFRKSKWPFYATLVVGYMWVIVGRLS